jgi:hypothetical protein
MHKLNSILGGNLSILSWRVLCSINYFHNSRYYAPLTAPPILLFVTVTATAWFGMLKYSHLVSIWFQSSVMHIAIRDLSSVTDYSYCQSWPTENHSWKVMHPRCTSAFLMPLIKYISFRTQNSHFMGPLANKIYWIQHLHIYKLFIIFLCLLPWKFSHFNLE